METPHPIKKANFQFEEEEKIEVAYPLSNLYIYQDNTEVIKNFQNV